MAEQKKSFKSIKDFAGLTFNILISSLALGLLFVLISSGNSLAAAATFSSLIFLGMISFYTHLYEKFPDIKSNPYISLIVFAFAIIIGFGILYHLPISEESYMAKRGTPTNLTWSDAFYFSASTMTTTGFGDITPNGKNQIYSMLEIFLGISTIILLFVTMYLDFHKKMRQ